MDQHFLVSVLLLLATLAASAEDFNALCEQRLAIERVYYAHRLGAKPPFEQVMPREVVEKLEREELRKERVLKERYGVEITPAMLEADVKRINTTTRAPDILAELKTALNHDPQSFARLIAKPITVDGELRARFDADERLHGPERRQVEQCRDRLLQAQKDGHGLAALIALFKGAPAGEVREVTWQLGADSREAAAPVLQAAGSNPANANSGNYSVQGALQWPQAVSSPAPGHETQCYFADLAPQLQRVLRVQLQKAGDLSAVIESPTAFLLFLATEKSDKTLGTVSLTVTKQRLEEWLAAQPDARDNFASEVQE